MRKFITFLLFLTSLVLLNNVYLVYINNGPTEEKLERDPNLIYPKYPVFEAKIKDIDNTKLLKIINNSWEWFLNNQNDDFLHYQYNLKTKKHLNEDHPLREMWALWSITKLYKLTKDERYKELINKWVSYFDKYIKLDIENDFYYVNIKPESIKLWYSAFMILSLVNSDHPKKDELITKLADGILYQQNDTWEFRTFFYSNTNTSVDYYPWEALVALMAVYNYNKNLLYLDAVKKAFPYYIEYFRWNPNTAFVPWQSRAYYEFHKITKDPEVAKYVFLMNDYMLNQHLPEKECSDFNFSRGIVTAVFTEWVLQAYKLAKETKDLERENCYKNFIKEVIPYFSFFQEIKRDDIKAFWWFKWHFNSPTMKVDRNQHAGMALIEAYELGIFNQ